MSKQQHTINENKGGIFCGGTITIKCKKFSGNGILQGQKVIIEAEEIEGEPQIFANEKEIIFTGNKHNGSEDQDTNDLTGKTLNHSEEQGEF